MQLLVQHPPALSLSLLCSLDGGELFDRIIDDNYQLTELDAIVFIRQICEGVRHMHQMYILHLDLKVGHWWLWKLYLSSPSPLGTVDTIRGIGAIRSEVPAQKFIHI